MRKSLRENSDYDKHKLFDITKFILVLPTVSTDTTVIIKEQTLNEKSAICFKITAKWKLTKSHTTD